MIDSSCVLAIELGRCMDGTSIRLHTPITTTQTVAPNDVTNAREQHLYLGCFGFIFVKWDIVERHRPSLYTVNETDMIHVFFILSNNRRGDSVLLSMNCQTLTVSKTA